MESKADEKSVDNIIIGVCRLLASCSVSIATLEALFIDLFSVKPFWCGDCTISMVRDNLFANIAENILNVFSSNDISL